MSNQSLGNMTGKFQSSVTRGADPLGDMETALAGLTKDLLPNYAATIQNTCASNLESQMLDCIAHCTASNLKGQDLTTTLGKMAIIMLAQFKSTRKELDYTSARTGKLERDMDETIHLLSQAHTKICQLKLQNEGTKQELVRAKHELMLSQQQQLRTESELTETKFRLWEAQQQNLICGENSTTVREERHSSPEINQGQTFELGPRHPQRGVTVLTPLNSWSPPNPVEHVSPLSLHQPFPHVQSPGPSDRELDKIARNIIRFEPTPEGSNDVTAYLKDIDYYLRRFPNVTIDHKIYLIKVTSNREVSSFIERQSDYVRTHYDALCQALVEEFSNHTEQTGLIPALTVKQQSQESPQLYYKRLFHTYFGPRNEPGMEEDLHFKTLFVENLHPTTSYHLGVAACPRTLSSKQLRDLALKGFAKHQQVLSNQTKPHSTLACDTQPLRSYQDHNCAQQLRSDEIQNHSGRHTDPLISGHHRNQFSCNQRDSVRDNQHPNQTIRPLTKTPPNPPQYDSTGLVTHKNQRMCKSKKADVNSNTGKFNPASLIEQMWQYIQGDDYETHTYSVTSDEPEHLFQTLTSPAKRVNEMSNASSRSTKSTPSQHWTSSVQTNTHEQTPKGGEKPTSPCSVLMVQSKERLDTKEPSAISGEPCTRAGFSGNPNVLTIRNQPSKVELTKCPFPPTPTASAVINAGPKTGLPISNAAPHVVKGLPGAGPDALTPPQLVEPQTQNGGGERPLLLTHKSRKGQNNTLGNFAHGTTATHYETCRRLCQSRLLHSGNDSTARRGDDLTNLPLHGRPPEVLAR